MRSAHKELSFYSSRVNHLNDFFLLVASWLNPRRVRSIDWIMMRLEFINWSAATYIDEILMNNFRDWLAKLLSHASWFEVPREFSLGHRCLLNYHSSRSTFSYIKLFSSQFFSDSAIFFFSFFANISRIKAIKSTENYSILVRTLKDTVLSAIKRCD